MKLSGEAVEITGGGFGAKFDDFAGALVLSLGIGSVGGASYGGFTQR